MSDQSEKSAEIMTLFNDMAENIRTNRNVSPGEDIADSSGI